MTNLQRRLLIYPLIYLVIGFLLFIFQRSLLYFPSEALQHNYASFKLENAGEHIEVIVLNPGKARAVIYFGGNAENVLDAAYDFGQALPEYSLYLFNYRGYGGSTGRPSEAAIYADAELVIQQLQAQHQRIALIGRSLGSGVATYLAARYPIEKLLLITPYDSIEALAQQRFLIYPMRVLLQDKFKSIEHVAKIHAPTLIITAGQDKVIPKAHSDHLIKAFVGKPLSVVDIAAAQHNDIVFYPEVLHSIQVFLAAQ